MAETMTDLIGTDLPYHDGRLDCLGYRADAAADAPWVVVVHEWSGLNHGTKAACDRLAGLGRAPDRHDPLALQHHVRIEDVRQFHGRK